MPFSQGLYCSIYEGGPLSQPPVILLHGAGSDRLCWPAALRRLPGQRVMALDLPGHGRSESMALQSIESYAQSVLGFMHGLGIYQATLVGHSMGGAIALQLAVQAPERVMRLGIISSGAALNVPPPLLSALENPALLKEGLKLLKDSLFGPQTSPGLQEKVMRKLQETRQSVLYGDWLACARFDLREQIARIAVPAWLATGAEDKVAPPYQSRLLAESIPQARLQIVPQAGHMLILESPDVLSIGLAEFLVA